MEAVFEPVNSRIPNRPLTLRSLENQDEMKPFHLSSCKIQNCHLLHSVPSFLSSTQLGREKDGLLLIR